MPNYLISNALLVNEGTIEKRDLVIKEGRITFDIPDDTDGYHIIDGSGCYLLPGVIDTHVHFRDGGDASNPAGDFSTESRAALSGGVTSIVDMPNTQPQTTSLETLERKEQMAAGCSAVNYGFMIGATNDNIDALLNIPPQRYAAIKLFLGSSTGNMLVDSPTQLDRLFQNARKLIVAHCEEEAVVQANMANFKLEFQGTDKENASLHPKIRNTEACYLSSYKAVERARKFGTRFHLAHVSTATELNLLSNQSISEKKITAEVTPNHLWFDERDYEALGNRIKCNPAIKSNEDRLALWAALYDGLIDTIATDHAPHTIEAKQKPYFDAPSGIPSIQHSLSMMLEPFFSPTQAEDKEDMRDTWLPLVVEKMCHNPATLFGISQRGFLREGYHADVVLVRPNAEGRAVDAKEIRYKCGWSPLEGQTFHSEVEKVFLNGQLAYDRGNFVPTIAAEALCFDR